MEPEKIRARLDRIDAIRSRAFSWAVATLCTYTLAVETVRHPVEMARMLFWLAVVIGGTIALHFAINWTVRRQ